MLCRLSRYRAWLVLVLCVVFLLAVPPRLQASTWAVMLAKVIEAVNTSTDIWEKHTRVIEDHLDQAGGLVQSFGSVNATFQTALAATGVQSHFKFLDVARSEYLSTDCFRGRWSGCADMDVFQDAVGENLDWRVGYALNTYATDYSTMEYSIRTGWDGLRPISGLGPGHSPFYLAAHVARMGIVDTVEEARQRAATRYRRARHRARARQDGIAAGRQAARQFLYHDAGEAGSYSASRPLGNMLGCPTDTPETVLGQAYLADCEDGDPAFPLGGDGDTHQHLSDLESRQLAVSMAVAAANADAARLALRLQDILQAAEAQQDADAADSRRLVESQERLEYAVGTRGTCRSHLWYHRCRQGLPVGDSDDFLAAANALGG